MPIPLHHLALHHGHKPKFKTKIHFRKFSIIFTLYRKYKSNYYHIGYVVLERVKGNFYETHSSIGRPSEWGKGYGIYLYSKAFDYAFKHNIKIASSNHPSRYATRVWKSNTLRQYYKIYYRGNRYWVRSI